jgi:hypothetical protein
MYKAQEQRKESNKQSNMTNEDEDKGDWQKKQVL